MLRDKLRVCVSRISLPLGRVALKQISEEFVYFAVKICQHARFSSATSTYKKIRKLEKRPKLQTSRRACVGLTDFPKFCLNKGSRLQ